MYMSRVKCYVCTDVNQMGKRSTFILPDWAESTLCKTDVHCALDSYVSSLVNIRERALPPYRAESSRTFFFGHREKNRERDI